MVKRLSTNSRSGYMCLSSPEYSQSTPNVMFWKRWLGRDGYRSVASCLILGFTVSACIIYIMCICCCCCCQRFIAQTETYCRNTETKPVSHVFICDYFLYTVGGHFFVDVCIKLPK